MVRQALGLSALFGLAANAFMIPSTMSLPDFEGERLPDISDLIPSYDDLPEMGKKVPVDIDNPFLNSENDNLWISPIPDDYDAYLPTPTELLGGAEPSWVHFLECPGCNHAEFTSSESSMLALEFAVDGSGKNLLLNDVPLYPLREIAPAFTAHETSSRNFMLPDSSSPSHEIDYQAAIARSPADPDSGNTVITVWYTVVGIDNVKTHLEPIKIRMLKTEADRLYLLDVSTDTVAPTEPTAPEEDCNGPAFFCKLFHLFDSKMAAWRSSMHHFKPCHGTKYQGAEEIDMPTLHGGIPKFTSPPTDSEESFPSDWNADRFHHPEHSQHHSHHHHRLHAFAKGVHNFIVGFMIPVLIGIMAGMFASLVGMAVGSCVAWTWIRFVRKGKRGPYARVASSDEGDEKSSALDSDLAESPPPVYVEKE